MLHLPGVPCDPENEGTSASLTMGIHEVTSSDPHDYIPTAVEWLGTEEANLILLRVVITSGTYD